MLETKGRSLTAGARRKNASQRVRKCDMQSAVEIAPGIKLLGNRWKEKKDRDTANAHGAYVHIYTGGIHERAVTPWKTCVTIHPACICTDRDIPDTRAFVHFRAMNRAAKPRAAKRVHCRREMSTDASISCFN